MGRILPMTNTPSKEIAPWRRPRHWYDLAARMRAMAADEIGDLKQTMLGCASEYDKLGDRAMERLAGRINGVS